jgi:exodeoxyribonuclease VII large subunit
MGLDTSAEEPAPVRTVSRLVQDWVGRLGEIWIDGQFAEVKVRPGSRQAYLTLRDTDVEMSLAVVADVSLLQSVEPPIAEGQRAVVRAKAEFWTGRGNLQFRAKEIKPIGLGELLAQLERLRKVLESEGLFAAARKRPLPFLPRKIGLICGRASAAMDDVLVNVEDRWPGMPFEVREVPVQGVQAVAAVTAALAELDLVPDVDVIIIARGGGSVEDLLPFSNEALVRAVSACRTPVISAIGHEQDAPLVDYVADLRASTPTDAAKRVVPSYAEQRALVDRLRAQSRRAVGVVVDRQQQLVQDLRGRSRRAVTALLTRSMSDIEHLGARVRSLSPAATLDRGYAIVSGPDHSIVRSAESVADGDVVSIKVAVGSFLARKEGAHGG